MTKFLLLFVLLLVSSFAHAITVEYSDGSAYTGEILIQDTGAFFVKEGELFIPANIRVKEDTKVFIPFTEKSFTYLGDFATNKIILPNADVSENDFALYNIRLKLLDNGNSIYFENSNSSAQIRESLVVPYLHKKNVGKIIVRKNDNFIVTKFDVPFNPKEQVYVNIDMSVPEVEASFYLRIQNEYIQLESPEMVWNTNGLTIYDSVSNYEEHFKINREMFFPNYYQNIIYQLNIDNNTVRKSDSSLLGNQLFSSHSFDDLSIFLSTKFKLNNLTEKILEKEKLSLAAQKAVEKTKEGSKGTLYYGLIFGLIIFVIVPSWNYRKEILFAFSELSKVKYDVRKYKLKKLFTGILTYRDDESFIDVIIRLKNSQSKYLDTETVESIVSKLINISNSIEKNNALVIDLISKKDAIFCQLNEAKKFISENELSLKHSTLNFAQAIDSFESSKQLIEEKLASLEQINKQYIGNFEKLTVYLSKFILDIEMENISQSLNIDIEDYEIDKKIIEDVFNLEKLENDLEYLNNFDEAFAELLSNDEKNQINKNLK